MSVGEGMLVKQVAAVVILAAGAGTRMKSAKSKLLHEVAGKSLVHRVIDAAKSLNPEKTIVVVGHLREQVEAHLREVAPHVQTALQPQTLGTGHAVRCGLDIAPDISGDIVVISGDSPLLEGETLTKLVGYHQTQGNSITVMSSRVPNPKGYGRIVRDHNQDFAEIVEDRDCNEQQRAIDEVNSGLYVFQSQTLVDGLAALTTDNSQGEYYLTDVLGFARKQGQQVGAWVLEDYLQAEGVNDRIQLAAMNAEANRRILNKWMMAGVTIIDPATTWIHSDVTIAADVTIYPNTQLYGATSIAENAVIGPDTTLKDVEVGAGAKVIRTQGELAVIGAAATVGPFSFLRPGTVLGEKGKIGGFVETKNARIGAGAKVPHLTYCGDAEIGAGANIGAGTIFANYDGINKHQSQIGEYAFIGSNTVLLAPAEVGAGAFVAGGSAITDPVGPGELAVARGRQRNIPGWVAKNKAGSKFDNAAQAAIKKES